MQRKNSQLIFSPRDLVAYLEGDFAAWMDRYYADQPRGLATTASSGTSDVKPQKSIQPDEPDEQLQLAAQKGREHEQAFLEHLVENGIDVAQIPQNEQAPAPLNCFVP